MGRGHALQCRAAFSWARMSCSTCSSALSDCEDFCGDTVADCWPLSHLGPPCFPSSKLGGLPGRIKQVSNSSNYSHIYLDKGPLIGPWGPCEVMAGGRGF